MIRAADGAGYAAEDDPDPGEARRLLRALPRRRLAVLLVLVVVNVFVQDFGQSTDPISVGIASWRPFEWTPRVMLQARRKVVIFQGGSGVLTNIPPWKETSLLLRPISNVVRQRGASEAGSPADPTRQTALRLAAIRTDRCGGAFVTRRVERRPDEPRKLVLARDGWGRPFVFRCPGPVHPNGWDLYSLGPNGIDDNGRGDDILIGEDLAPVTTATRPSR